MFKDIPGWEGLYQVDENGTVISTGTYQHNQFVGEHIVSCPVHTKGYREFHALDHRTNRNCNVKVHRAVALAFIPNPDNKPCVNHIDGNKLNNHVSNLEWVTYQENTIHAVKTGLMQFDNLENL